MKYLLLLVALPLAAQQVTISQQPVRYLLPAVGNIGVYSAEICSTPGVTVSGSWGQIRQIAEIGGINILDPVLVGPTAQVAEAKTRTHKVVSAAGVIGLAALFVAVFHQPPLWLIEGAATLTGGAQVAGNYFAQGEAKIQGSINAALAAVADPTAQFSVGNGACVSSRLFLGDYKAKFVPIRAELGGQPTPANAPKSIIPTDYTHPALAPPMEVAAWETTPRDPFTPLDESDRASGEFVALVAMQTMR